MSVRPRAYPVNEVRRMAAEAGWTVANFETTPVGFEALLSQ